MTAATDPVRSILIRKGREVWSVSPDSSVHDAIAIMADRHVGALLVLSGDTLVGIVSERDCARKVVLEGRSATGTRAEEIMTTPVVFVTPQHNVDDCMRIMTTSRIRHLPVLDGDRVVGVVSIGDLVKWIISAQDETIHQLEGYITGKYPA